MLERKIIRQYPYFKLKYQTGHHSETTWQFKHKLVRRQPEIKEENLKRLIRKHK